MTANNSLCISCILAYRQARSHPSSDVKEAEQSRCRSNLSPAYAI
jgi:hypothetical protein